jgi:hypothetical protein
VPNTAKVVAAGSPTTVPAKAAMVGTTIATRPARRSDAPPGSRTRTARIAPRQPPATRPAAVAAGLLAPVVPLDADALGRPGRGLILVLLAGELLLRRDVGILQHLIRVAGRGRNPYNHCALLRSIEARFGLPRLRHVGDPGTATILALAAAPTAHGASG